MDRSSVLVRVPVQFFPYNTPPHICVGPVLTRQATSVLVVLFLTGLVCKKRKECFYVYKFLEAAVFWRFSGVKRYFVDCLNIH